MKKDEQNSILFLVLILIGSAIETARNFTWLGVCIITTCLFFLAAYAVMGRKVKQQRKRAAKQCAVHGVSDMHALPEEVLTPEQIEKALSWYCKHRGYINDLVNGVSKFPPSLREDKRDCRLWKSEHWNWFISHYH